MFYSIENMDRPSLGELELAVLLSVARLHDDAYGARVRRDVSTRAGRDYAVGAIYATLQRLEDKGFVASWTTDPTPVRGGRARRCFRLTPDGEWALREARRTTERLWEAVDVAWQP